MVINISQIGEKIYLIGEKRTSFSAIKVNFNKELIKTAMHRVDWHL